LGAKGEQPVVSEHADHRNEQADQTGQHAAANGIGAQRGRNAAFLFDTNRRLQRVLEDTGKPTRFFLSKTSGDDSVAPINGIANHRGGLNDAIKDNRESIAFVLLGDLAEFLCAFAVELQLHSPAFIPVISAGSRDTTAVQICLLLNEEPFFLRLFLGARYGLTE